MSSSFLMVFDFDHTVVDDNTDVVVQSLPGKPALSAEVSASSRTQGWTEFMQRVFDFHADNGATKADYDQVLSSIPLVKGMKELLTKLKESELNAEVIIISDSNSEFIGHILKEKELEKCFDQVFTNPATYDEKERLNVKPYHHQTSCKLSNVNLCKGQVLRDYISQRKADGVTFSFVAYAGDGANDFCPMATAMTAVDMAFPRDGDNYAIRRHMDKMKKKEQGLEVQAETVFWTDAGDILEALQERVRQK